MWGWLMILAASEDKIAKISSQRYCLFPKKECGELRCSDDLWKLQHRNFCDKEFEIPRLRLKLPRARYSPANFTNSWNYASNLWLSHYE